MSELASLGDGALLAVSGIGQAAAQRAALALIQAGASALMTFGMAGGLDPSLKAGSVVLPCELICADGTRFAASQSWRERVAAAVSPLRAVCEGSLLTSARPIDTPADKAAAFRNSGAVAVDMESAAVAQVAADHQLPFIAVRVIVDTAADRLPRTVVNASRAGRLRIGRLLAGLVVAPGEIAGLIRLTQRYRIAMRSLRVIGAHIA
ncbi:MAG: purine and other phosphorylase-like protein, family 1 [Pseudomonadota bacterium]|nr:purine and other phosphorylase-like protein, family 1 [Pseudomonadota bacterium]